MKFTNWKLDEEIDLTMCWANQDYPADHYKLVELILKTELLERYTHYYDISIVKSDEDLCQIIQLDKDNLTGLFMETHSKSNLPINGIFTFRDEKFKLLAHINLCDKIISSLNRKSYKSLLALLRDSISSSAMWLDQLLFISDYMVIAREEGRLCELAFTPGLINSLYENFNNITHVFRENLLHKSLENEILEAFLSFERDTQDEIYLNLLKNSLTDLRELILQIDVYIVKSKFYNNIIETNDAGFRGNNLEIMREVLLRMSSTDSFGNIGNNARALTKAICNTLPDAFLKNIDTDIINREEKPIGNAKGLSASQQLLFIRLLQKFGMFPKKPDNTDDAPELRAIALMTGLDYLTDIKGGKGAKAKVEAILDPIKRLKFTNDQLIHKLGDIDAVLKVARLLNVGPVISALDLIRTDLKKIRDSR